MRSRRPTRTGIDLAWRATSQQGLLSLLLAAAAAPGTAADDLVTGLIPRESALPDAPEARARPGDGRLRLRIAWYDILRRTPFPFDVMSAEVERLLGGERVDVTLRVVEDDGEVLEDSEIKVILLDRPRAKSARDHHVMGSTPREGVGRAAWAFSSTVAWALGLTREASLPPPEQQEFARALARVVAHEIVHVIAPEIPHARRGLMQPGMDRSELLMPGLGLESAERRTFEAGLASFTSRPDPLVRSAAGATPRRHEP